MINALIILLGFQLIGEATVVTLRLPVPGPVVGMLLLLITLLFRGAVPGSLQSTAQGVLRHLSLLYIPAGVGIIAHFARLKDTWVPVIVTLLASTVVTLAITALAMRFLLRVTGTAMQREGRN